MRFPSWPLLVWGQRGDSGAGAAPGTFHRGEGGKEPGLNSGWGFFNYTIKCTIRYNYQRSEGATVHNRHVIYCSHCLYCSAPLPNDYGKLSHLHGCHGNGGQTAASGTQSPRFPAPVSPRRDTVGAVTTPHPRVLRAVGAGVEGWGRSRDGQRQGSRGSPGGELCVLEV